MSKGSQVIPVRIPKELLTEIEQAIQSANLTTGLEPYTVSSWIRKCVAEKLAHLKRSRRRPRGRKDRPQESGNIPDEERDQHPQDVLR